MKRTLGIALIFVAAGCAGGISAPKWSGERTVTTIEAESRVTSAQEAPAPHAPSFSGYGGYAPPPTSTPPATPSPSPGRAASPSPSVDQGWAVNATTPPPPPPPQWEPTPVEPRPTERPGLGTTWGESRFSRVREVAFERGGDQPVALASIYYNDREGSDAMADYARRRGGRFGAPIPIRGGVTASIVDERGVPLEGFEAGGRVHVVGEAGRRYSIVVTNHTTRRVELVASVDGLDVVDGQPADTEKRGYVIQPWGRVVIDGFRKSEDEVAAFRFGAVSASYAAKTAPTGDRNVGVIGLALWDERGAAPWTDEEIERRFDAQPFGDTRFARPPAN